MRIKKAVITAAGWGTRFLPVTKSQPKEMLPLLNKPIIQYSVEEAIACGIDLVVIITSMGKRAIEDYFDHHFELESMLERKGETRLLEEVRRSSNMVDIGYIRQKEQLGLGHAVLTAKNMVGNEPFFLMLPDDLFENRELVLKEMMRIYENYQGSVVAVKRVAEDEVNRYGIIEYKQVADRIFKVIDLVEKPRSEDAPSDLAIMGRYLLPPEIFGAIQETSPGRNGEIQLTDALRRLLKQRPLYAYEFEGERWDAGTLPGWLEVTIALALQEPEIAPRLRKYLHKISSETASAV
ncbi:MAG TPA: UTP--glucose-1-phosphate uridylyltransferase GalU [Dehalococcoidia bacterium]|nr:UTP--glucose-1-phosphate uridylyltransferase GalU [Dehalococcoidia bacterium]